MQIQFFTSKPKVLVCTTSQSTFDNIKKTYGKTFNLVIVREISQLRLSLAKNLLPVIFDATSFGIDDTVEYMEEYDEKFGEVEPGKTFSLFLSDNQIKKYLNLDAFTKDKNIIKELYDFSFLGSIANVSNLATYPPASFISEIQDESQTLEDVIDIFPKAKEVYQKTISDLEKKNSSMESQNERIGEDIVPQPEDNSFSVQSNNAAVANTSSVLGDVPELNLSEMIKNVSASGVLTVPEATPGEVPEAPTKSSNIGVEKVDNNEQEITNNEDTVSVTKYNQLVDEYKDLEQSSLSKLQEFDATNELLQQDNVGLQKELQELKYNQSSLSITEFKKELTKHEQNMNALKNSLESETAHNLEIAEAKVKESESVIQSLASQNADLQSQISQIEEDAEKRIAKVLGQKAALQHQLDEMKNKTEEWVNSYNALMMNSPFAAISDNATSANNFSEQQGSNKSDSGTHYNGDVKSSNDYQKRPNVSKQKSSPTKTKTKGIENPIR